jgi:hypothetical protein
MPEEMGKVVVGNGSKKKASRRRPLFFTPRDAALPDQQL